MVEEAHVLVRHARGQEAQHEGRLRGVSVWGGGEEEEELGGEEGEEEEVTPLLQIRQC